MAAAGTEDGEQRWEIPCRDVSGRPRMVAVVFSAQHVVLGVPPGESAELDWQTAEELSRLLHMGALAALGRRVG
jgi:hypothetical protein